MLNTSCVFTQVSQAMNGEEAIAALQKQMPDVMLLVSPNFKASLPSCVFSNLQTQRSIITAD